MKQIHLKRKKNYFSNKQMATFEREIKLRKFGPLGAEVQLNESDQA